MKTKTTVTAIIMLSCGLAAACDRREASPGAMAEEGCMTASGSQFVLTDLESGSPLRRFGDRTEPSAGPTTEAYLLVGPEHEFRRLVGQHVRVTGEIEPTQTAELRDLTPMVRVDPDRPAATTGNERPQPHVRSEQRVSLRVHQMHVRSIKPTGDSCEESLD
jgi:hypothetical protein